MAPTKAIAVKRAIDRIIKGPVDDADLRLAEKGVNDERIWAMVRTSSRGWEFLG